MDPVVEALRLYLEPHGAKRELIDRLKGKGVQLSPSVLSRILKGGYRLPPEAREEIAEILNLELEACRPEGSPPGAGPNKWEVLDQSGEFVAAIQQGRWKYALLVARGFLPWAEAWLRGGGETWLRPLFVENALLAVGVACNTDDLGFGALLLAWARREMERISPQEIQKYLRETGSDMDPDLFMETRRLNLAGAEASFQQNRRNWRQAYALREGILQEASRLPEPLASYYRVGARIGQLLVLPRIPRFSIRRAIDLIHQVRDDLEAKDWGRLAPAPVPLPDPGRFQTEALFYAERGLLMAYARYGGDWIRMGERLARAGQDRLERISDPLLRCSFLRAYADYRWRLEPPDWGGGLEALEQALKIADAAGLASQRRKIMEEVRQAERRAGAHAAPLRRFREEHGRAEDGPAG